MILPITLTAALALSGAHAIQRDYARTEGLRPQQVSVVCGGGDCVVNACQKWDRISVVQIGYGYYSVVGFEAQLRGRHLYISRDIDDTGEPCDPHGFARSSVGMFHFRRLLAVKRKAGHRNHALQ